MAEAKAEETVQESPKSGQAPLLGLPPAALLPIYVAIALLPLALSWLQGLEPRAFWRELSGGLAMVGFAMMLVQFVLSGRFERVSGKTGIDFTMRFHQLAAWSVLLFVLVHPFLYAAPRLWTDPFAAIAQLQRMFSSEGLRSGVIAWWLLVLMVPMAVWRDRLPIGYEIWRLSHGVAALLIALLGLHHTLRVGTHAADPVLATVWILLGLVAVASLVFVYGVKPFLKARAPYVVVTNKKVADRMWEVAVAPASGEAIDFRAGQFAWVNFGHAAWSLTEHPFSISSAPHERPRIAFTIKESGDFTNHIGEIGLGSRAYLDGPHGSFTMAGREAAGVVLIAGGVGLAPIMGILRDLHARAFHGPVHLIYGNRVASQILYRDELRAMSETLDLALHLVLSEPPPGWTGRTGEITGEILRGCLEHADRHWPHFVCGPIPMMDSVERSLAELGVPAAAIVAERFRYD